MDRPGDPAPPRFYSISIALVPAALIRGLIIGPTSQDRRQGTGPTKGRPVVWAVEFNRHHGRPVRGFLCRRAAGSRSGT